MKTSPTENRMPQSRRWCHAAKLAHADAFIRRLPGGYQAQVGEEGGNLSQGQKQLLCIARILLTDPRMLILDEATSSIDTRTEQAVQHAFDMLMQGRTSFIVAHRLSTIEQADLILGHERRANRRARHPSSAALSKRLLCVSVSQPI